MYGIELDGALLKRPVFSTNFGAGRSRNRVFTRGQNDPAAVALAAVGAVRAPADSIEMCTWDSVKMQLAAIRPFKEKEEISHVFKLPPRRVVEGRTKHQWSYGTRLGPKATGCWSNLVEDAQQPTLPPLLRKVNWRELLHILEANNQVGLPTSVNTDGKLGWALYAYMSPEILMGRCDGAQSLLLRVEGVCSEGSDALKNELAQRAKCGICPCCALATHVLVPAAYEIGRYDRRQANTTLLWQRHGPMATRNYAAADYYN